MGNARWRGGQMCEQVGPCGMRLLKFCLLVISSGLVGGIAAAETPKASLSPEVSRHIAAYLAAVNANDEAAADKFRTEDVAPAFAASVPRDPFVQYFTNQKRVTGGVELEGVLMVEPHKAELLLKDTIYGARHGLTLTFDDGPEARLTNFEPGPAPRWAPRASAKLTAAEVALRARRQVERGCQSKVFSGAVLVAHWDRVLVEEACGSANRRYAVANRADTRFNLGSMNKMFTAVAVMQLVEAGKVALDDPLSKYADDSWLPPEISRQITIRHLLNHRSGLGSFFGPEFEKSSRLLYREVDDYKPLVRGAKLSFKPGSAFDYSDTGMLLLGVVIEKASGENYFDYVRQHVFRPAGMNDTDSWPMDEPIPNLAMGYGWAPGTAIGWRENTFRHVLRGGPAGGGYSTVGDLNRFAHALQKGLLVSIVSRDFLWADQPPNNYGAGFTVETTSAGRAVGHDGIFSGVSSRLEIYLDQGYVVAILGNQDYAQAGLNDALEELVAAAK